MNTPKYVALALREDEARAAAGACLAAQQMILSNPELYARTLKDVDQTVDDLIALYVRVALKIADKLES